LSALAAIRGDADEAALFARARRLAERRGIADESQLQPLFDMAVSPADADALVRLRQMYETAGWVLVESTLADIPADLRWLYESNAATLRQIATLIEQLDATSAIDLAFAASEHRIAPILGDEVEEAIAAAIPTVRARIPRVPLGRAVVTAEPLIERLRDAPFVRWVEPAGSLRRGADFIGDIELVVSSDHPADVIAVLGDTFDSARWLHRSARRAYVLTDRLQVGVRVVPPENAGAVLLHLTGAAPHLTALTAHAHACGWRLTTAGLCTLDGTLHAAPLEEDIYETLRLPPIPPEIRRTAEAVDVAIRGQLPQFVTRSDIRGDLHMHTTWSDGRDSVETMVAACQALGYEYCAITDHSQRSAASRNLAVNDIAQQADEIAAARERYPDIEVLHGCEVDIMPDGTLDFPDAVLEQFDVVLASLHERAGHGPDQLLGRYLSAMRHPLVTLITHPTNRLVPTRPGYDLDYPRLFAAAVETGTLLEIDGAPAHLDLNGDQARQAIEAGATVVIDSDCHRAEWLERQMRLGILMARRGWVEPRHVFNTRPIADVRRAIAAKRGR
jgi:DNA polymerase (family 10)